MKKKREERKMKKERLEGCSLLANSAKLSCFFLFSLISFLLSCNEPVFYEISRQIKIPPPRISGSPTAFAEIEGNMYVASGKTIHIYDTSTASTEVTELWDKVDPNLGRITFLAGTDSNLFIISDNGLFVSKDLSPLAFTQLTLDGHRFLTMYSADNTNTVFIGSRKTVEPDKVIYSILCATTGDDLVEITSTNNCLLNGVAFNGAYFLSVKDIKTRHGGGIYHGTTSSLTLINNIDNIPFMGIVSVDDSNILAIERNGKIYNVTGESIEESDFSTGKMSNGVLFVSYAFNNVTGKLDSPSRLLLAGRQDSLQYDPYTGYTYGYLEIELEGSNIKPGAVFREPGVTAEPAAPSTLPRGTGHSERYKTTLGTNPIKFIYKANDENSTLFVSTHQNGVWSLRERNDSGYPYWNTEN